MKDRGYERALNRMSLRQTHENVLKLLGYYKGTDFRTMLPLYFVPRFGVTDCPRPNWYDMSESPHTGKEMTVVLSDVGMMRLLAGAE